MAQPTSSMRPADRAGHDERLSWARTVYSNFSSLRYFFCGILGFVLVVLRFGLVHNGFSLVQRLLRLIGAGRFWPLRRNWLDSQIPW